MVVAFGVLYGRCQSSDWPEDLLLATWAFGVAAWVVFAGWMVLRWSRGGVGLPRLVGGWLALAAISVIVAAMVIAQLVEGGCGS